MDSVAPGPRAASREAPPVSAPEPVASVAQRHQAVAAQQLQHACLLASVTLAAAHCRWHALAGVMQQRPLKMQIISTFSIKKESLKDGRIRRISTNPSTQ